MWQYVLYAVVVLVVMRILLVKQYAPSVWFGPLKVQFRNDSNRHDLFYEWMQKFNGIAQMFIVNRYFFIVSRPDIIKRMFADKKSYEPRTELPFADYPLGLLHMKTSERARLHRRLLSPLFSQRFLRSYAETISSKAELMCDRWAKQLAQPPMPLNAMPERERVKWSAHAHSKEAANTPLPENRRLVDAHNDLMNVTLDIIGKIGFNREFDALSGAASPFRDAGNILIAHAEQRVSISPIARVLNIPFQLKLRKAKQLFNSAAEEMIDKHLAMDPEQRAHTEAGGLNMLSAMCDARDDLDGKAQLSREEIVHESVHFMMAGHETTSNTCSWAVYLLSTHPDIQERLYAEIESVAPGGKPLGLEEVEQMTLLRNVFNESLRMFPTVPTFARTVVQEREVVPGVTFPKNAVVLLHVYTINKNPDIWAEPHKFIPDRFDEKSPYYRKITINEFFPFATGERNCIGQRLAMLEGPLLLATIVRRFRLYPAYKAGVHPPHQINITMAPKNGLFVEIESR